MKVALSTGQTLSLTHVRLFDEAAVGRITALKASAAKALGGSGLSLGVIGTPSMTLAAEAVAVSFVSGLLNNAAQKRGAEELQNASVMYNDQLMSGGFYFAVQNVAGLQIPNPSAWSASNNGRRYVHIGDEFVWCFCDSGYMQFRWTEVAAVVSGDVAPVVEVDSTPEKLARPYATPTDRHGEYRGVRYALHADGRASTKVRSDYLLWKSQSGFQRWVDALPP